MMRFFWFLSILMVLFLCVVLNISLPSPLTIDLYFVKYGIEKNHFFYLTLGIFIVINFFLEFWLSYAYKIPHLFMIKKNKLKNIAKQHFQLKIWYQSLNIILNLFITSALLIVYNLNQNERILPIEGFIFIISILFFLWLIAPIFFSIFKKRKSFEN